MGTGYTRADVSNNIADGNIINSSDLDNEYDAIEAAFNSSTGHTHDGTSAEGGPITVVGPVQDLVVSATEVKPKTTNTLDLGTSGLLYKDAYLQGNMYFRDTALKIVSSADGQLDIDADVEVEITAPTLDIDASTAVTIDTATLTITGSANVTGDLDVDNININGNTIISTDTNGNIALTPNGTGEVDISKVDIDSGAIDGTVIGASSAAAITGTTITGTSFVSSGDMTFGDNDKAIFGAGSDLQIYHDGSNSYIDEQGTGDLIVRGANIQIKAANNETFANFSQNDAVRLYFDNAQKLATTATGVDVTGTVTADGLTVDTNTLYVDSTNNRVGIGTSSPSSQLEVSSNGDTSLTINAANNSDSKLVFSEQDNPEYSIIMEGVSGSTQSLQFYNNRTSSEAMRIDSSGNVGIGTSSPLYNLDVGSGSGSNSINIFSGSADTSSVYFTDNTTGVGSYIGRLAYDHNADAMIFTTNAAEAMRIDSSGNVGIGTSSPDQTLVVKTADGGGIAIENAAGNQYRVAVNGDDSFSIVDSGTAERFRITSAGNVGIGVSLPARILDISTTGSTSPRLTGTSSNGAYLDFHNNAATTGRFRVGQGYASGTDNIGFLNNEANAALAFGTNNNERMRIDSSGNVLVGKTNNALANDGVVIRGGGEILATNTSDLSGNFNRLSTDGGIVGFYKDGSSVGNISYSSATNIAINNANSKGLGIGSGSIFPTNGSTGINDAGLDLGYSSSRWKDLYLSGGAYLGGITSANYLDDYEEGTWTGTVSANYGFTPGASVTINGNYVKIGDMVNVNCSIDFDTAETLALGDRFIIQGIPFIMTGSQNGVGGGSFIQPGSFASGTHVVGTVASNSQSQDELMCVVTRVNGTPPALNATNVNLGMTYKITNTF